MNHNELLKKAKCMIEYCSNNVSCKECPGNVYIKEFDGKLCDISEYSENERQMTVDQVLEALTNLKRCSNE